MTDRQIIATLLKALDRHKRDWDLLDRDAAELAIRHLEAGDILAETGRLRRNVGGLCDNCGLPAHVHTVDRCPSEDQASRLQESIDRWDSIVRPAREAYQQAHADAKQARRNVRRGLATENAYRGAERAADAAWGRYQAAIRQADRES